MQRVLVTGNAGSGKTTVAITLADLLNLPYSGLDAIVWQPGWIKTPKHSRDACEVAIAKRSSWVVDGVSEIMLEAADTVIFLDFPRYTCYWRVLVRNLPFLFRSRPGLPAHCPEILVMPRLVKLIWRFPKWVRPSILETGRDEAKRFIHIRSSKELLQLVENSHTVGA